jgi:hypothetical protein
MAAAALPALAGGKRRAGKDAKRQRDRETGRWRRQSVQAWERRGRLKGVAIQNEKNRAKKIRSRVSGADIGDIGSRPKKTAVQALGTK